MLDQIYKSFSMLIAVFVISLALTTNSYALFLTGGTSSYSWKTLANGNDFVCQADDGEISIDVSISPVGFVMESPIDTDLDSLTNGQRISHTCCEVPHVDEGAVDPDTGEPVERLSVADCEAVDENGVSNPNCTCGEFILDQKVEDYTPNGVLQGDSVPSNCLEVDETGGTHSCQVSNGAPKETWVWHLIAVHDDEGNPNPLCASISPSTCDGSCGVAMGTADPAKANDHPYGIVWQYKQYIDTEGKTLLADFQGNWCHTGSFCLDDDITCSVKKLDLLTNSTAEYIVVEVDTVNTFNGNSTSGNTPTDFLSAVIEGVLVDPTEIDTTSITLNGSPITVLSYTIDSDRNGDGFADMRTHLSTEDYQQALYPDGGCMPTDAKSVLFKGAFTDGRGWIGETTVNVVCN